MWEWKAADAKQIKYQILIKIQGAAWNWGMDIKEWFPRDNFFRFQYHNRLVKIEKKDSVEITWKLERKPNT